MNIYLQGLTMGLAYVAPIGLQNLFVINSALTQKRSRVYITALIVILWDVSLGVACFLGAGALMQAEEVADGKTVRRLWGTRIRKFGERWMANVLEVETLGSGHRTKITVEELK